MGLLEGCRAIAGARVGLAAADASDPDITTIVAIESELDGSPLGPARVHWENGALAREDAQRAAYLADVDIVLKNALKSLLKKWQGNDA